MSLTFEQTQQIAADAAIAKANAALRAVAVLHIQFVRLLIAKGILSRPEYAASITKLQTDAVASRTNAPEFFHALTTMTMTLEQIFSEAPSGEPS